MSIRDLLLRGDAAFTPSEEKIVQLLLTDYPTSGLGTATSLARKAGVSDPTVVRLVMKLGFDGFPDFQSKLLAEVESRLHSPLLMMEAKRHDHTGTGKDDGPALSYMRSVMDSLDKAMSTTPASTYDRATRLVTESKGRVILLGGRFSRHVAGMLAGYLVQFRPGIVELGAISATAFDTLIDVDRRDVLIVFDYRRYQLDVVAFAEQAASRGVRIVLFTDPWLSPIAQYAEVTIVSPLEVASPYDTLAPAIAQVEALVANMLSNMNDATRNRIERLEDIRRDNAVTLDNARALARLAKSPKADSRNFPGPKTSRQEQ
ncbi:MurR/RpiR family transcriptional regulator [Phyllobacterium sp. SB3]|uniref:MurR/RpiR family transcriptional regulator n=1 Tax=Phyllobacterium sp. SB3 TaxID=3156073 RepID=UPI0032AFFEF7